MMTQAIWHIDVWHLTLRLGLSLVLGGLIGLEREINHHPAGFRTHILVCIGSASIMLLSIYGFSEFVKETNVRIDPARIAAQVVSGIGFLGAGTILRNGSSVSGLTTAASLWVTAGIGLSVGAGLYNAALITAALVLICLFLLNKFGKKLNSMREQAMLITIGDDADRIGEVVTGLESANIQILKMTVTRDADTCKHIIRCVYQPERGQDNIENILATQIGGLSGVQTIQFERGATKTLSLH
ncbi:MAG TPA: MgtC/SapB family protein [Bacilli bacterium]